MSQPPKQRSRQSVGVRAWRSMLELVFPVIAVLDDELEKESGVDLTTYDALIHVYEAGPEGMRMTDLSNHLLLSKSGLTALVDRLEARGLFQRIADPTDRRAIRVAITDEGKQTFKVAAKAHVAGIERHFSSHLTDEEAETILELMGRIRHAE